MPTTNDTRTRNDFWKQVDEFCSRNRGDRASLRRYWSDTTRHQSYPVLGQLGALRDERRTILAALYAVHPSHKIGSGVGRAALRLGDRKDGEHPYDRHFRRLLSSDSLEDLGRQLHRLAKRLEREGIPLDYERVHRDLNFWKDYDEKVKVEWAADFWQAPIPGTNPEKEVAV